MLRKISTQMNNQQCDTSFFMIYIIDKFKKRKKLYTSST